MAWIAEWNHGGPLEWNWIRYPYSSEKQARVDTEFWLNNNFPDQWYADPNAKGVWKHKGEDARYALAVLSEDGGGEKVTAWEVHINRDGPKESSFFKGGLYASEAEAVTWAESEMNRRYAQFWERVNYQWDWAEKGVGGFNLAWMKQVDTEVEPMLYIFDLDDTLIDGFVKRHPYERVVALPGRVERLRELQFAQGHNIAICTNQANIAFGYNTEAEAYEKFRKVYEVLELSPEQVPLMVCFSHPGSKDDRYNHPTDMNRRKPAPAMILEAQAFFDGMGLHYRGSRVVYVGDRKEDQGAADNAEVSFEWTWEFFGDPVPKEIE